MFLRIPLLTVLLILFLSSSPGVCGDVEIPPLEERVKEIQLDNGLKVVVVERQNAPVFFALMTFRVGSSIEDVGKSGLSHFMEHMLFKGSETIGTSDYSVEKPIMEELELVAEEMRDMRVKIEQWRFDIFREYMGEVKANLPAEVRESTGQDEASILRSVLERLPANLSELPEEWQITPWIYNQGDRNFWSEYKKTIELKIKILELIKEQRKIIVQTELNSIYDSHGAQMTNAFTSYDQTGYMVGLPSNCLELWMNLESDRFINPVFREFYSEREVVQEELLGRENNAGSFLFINMVNNSFVAHPYGRPIIGWKQDIQLTLREEMDNHFRKFYGPNNCQITIVGNVDTEEVFALARKHFSPWEAGEIAHEVTIKEPEQYGEKRMEVEFDAEPTMIIGYHVPAAPHPDNYALQMLNMIMSSGRTSRLYKNIFQTERLTARPPYSFIGPGDRYPGTFLFFVSPNSDHTYKEVENSIYREIEDLKNTLVSSYELEKIKNSFKTYQLGRLRSNQWLAFSLAEGFAMRGEWRSIVDDYERLMKVSADDIQRVAKKYFEKKNRTVAILVKPESLSAESDQENISGGEE